jgi:hypothetical protein
MATLGSRDSSVGIATRYGLEGPGIESRWSEIFRTYPDRRRGPPSLLYSGYRVFPGGKGGRGVMLTTHPLLVPRLTKSWAIPPLTLWVLLGLLLGSLYLNLWSIYTQPILTFKILYYSQIGDLYVLYISQNKQWMLLYTALSGLCVFTVRYGLE